MLSYTSLIPQTMPMQGMFFGLTTKPEYVISWIIITESDVVFAWERSSNVNIAKLEVDITIITTLLACRGQRSNESEAAEQWKTSQHCAHYLAARPWCCNAWQLTNEWSLTNWPHKMPIACARCMHNRVIVTHLSIVWIKLSSMTSMLKWIIILCQVMTTLCTFSVRLWTTDGADPANIYGR